MRVILFCQNAYAFGIMAPIRELLYPEKYIHLWYLPKKLLADFPYKKDNYTTSVLDLQLFKSDVIFVPGNEVPYFLRGLKVQIFHGLAGEKKGHFRIRNYFDLYLTQGPYFTKKFNELRVEYRNFDVIETGWSKLDVYGKDLEKLQLEKKEALKAHHTNTIVLYAPTFSPKLTSAPFLLEEIEKLALETEFLIYIKFHDLMDKEWILDYKKLAERIPNIKYKEDKNIVKFLIQADILISDTSSVIYEFLLLDKPVISFKNISENIQWHNSSNFENLKEKVNENLEKDPFKEQRQAIQKEFHPYNDALSSQRMLTAVENYIEKKGIPERRILSRFRKFKIHRIFGKPILILWDGKKINKITALLITYNEIENIDAFLENVSFVDEIIVIDSLSTDGTRERLRQYPKVTLIERPFKNFTDQKSFALEQANNDWVLFMDADERLTDALKNEILLTINSEKIENVAFMFLRIFMFRKELLRFSGWQSDKNFRLFRKSKVYFDTSRRVHETLILDGNYGVMKNKLIHYSYKNYDDYKGKMVKYGQIKAQEELEKNYTPNPYHFIIRPFYKFFNHYIFRLGFLDGKKGMIICYLNALGVFERYKELKRLLKEQA